MSPLPSPAAPARPSPPSPSPLPQTRRPATEPISRPALLLLLLILILAAVLRFYLLAGQSFWADEGNSVVLAGREPTAILAAAAADIHPPAYYLLLAGWGRVFGLGETGARGLSAVLGVVVVAVMFVLGLHLRGVGLGLAAAFLSAVNPFLIYYSQEARMYELLTACAAFTGLALALLAQPQRPRLPAAVLYIAFATLGLYTHYAFPIHLLALNCVFLLWLWQARRRQQTPGATRLGWFVLQAIPALLYAPWLPIALRQLRTWPSPAVSLGPGQALAETFRLFSCGPTLCSGPLILLAVSALIASGLLIAAVLPPARLPHRRSAAALPLLWLLAPLAAMLVFRIFSPVFFKFLLLAAPAYLLLLALGNARIVRLIAARLCLPGATWSRSLLHLPLLLLLVLPAVPALARYYHDPTIARDDYRGLAAYLRALAGAEDAVILLAPGQADAFGQYDHGPAPVYPLPRARPLDAAATLAEIDRILAAADRVFAIYWASEQADPERLIERYLAAHAFQAWDVWVGNLRFVAYSAESPPDLRLFSAPVPVGPAFALTGIGVSPGPVQPGDIARVLLNWRSLAETGANYKITLQLLDAVGQVAAQVDSEPVGGARPTSGWRPGDEITDPYGLAIPLATPPGSHRLILAVYDAATGDRLPIPTEAGVGDHLELGALRIDPPAAAPPVAILPIAHRVAVPLGPFTFLGHDRFKQGFDHAPETPLAAGDSLHLSTWWRADQPPGGDYNFELLLDGRALGRFPLAGPTFPTGLWQPGQPWRGEISLPLPPDLASGRNHTLGIQLIAPSGQPFGQVIRLQPALRY
jgi:hypothetical protein